jgi:hypothetical protein
MASMYNNASGSGWEGWSPDDSYQSVTMLVTDQSASSGNIKQVLFYSVGGFSIGDYRMIYQFEHYD